MVKTYGAQTKKVRYNLLGIKGWHFKQNEHRVVH